jgi:hypothetical protein
MAGQHPSGEVRRRYIESGHTYTVGKVQREGDLLTVSMAAVSGLDGANACQHALGARANVVVGARSCVTPAGITPDGSIVSGPQLGRKRRSTCRDDNVRQGKNLIRLWCSKFQCFSCDRRTCPHRRQ